VGEPEVAVRTRCDADRGRARGQRVLAQSAARIEAADLPPAALREPEGAVRAERDRLDVGSDRRERDRARVDRSVRRDLREAEGRERRGRRDHGEVEPAVLRESEAERTLEAVWEREERLGGGARARPDAPDRVPGPLREPDFAVLAGGDVDRLDRGPPGPDPRAAEA